MTNVAELKSYVPDPEEQLSGIFRKLVHANVARPENPVSTGGLTLRGGDRG